MVKVVAQLKMGEGERVYALIKYSMYDKVGKRGRERVYFLIKEVALGEIDKIGREAIGLLKLSPKARWVSDGGRESNFGQNHHERYGRKEV